MQSEDRFGGRQLDAEKGSHACVFGGDKETCPVLLRAQAPSNLDSCNQHLAHDHHVFLRPWRSLLWYYLMRLNGRAFRADRCLLPVSVLLVNAIAILSEDRFLARSTQPLDKHRYSSTRD
jgi:hypothetical protein